VDGVKDCNVFMEFTENIADIDFDGSKIVEIDRDGSDLSVEVQNCTFLKSHPASKSKQNRIGLLKIDFHCVTEETSEIHVGSGKTEINKFIPPLDVIEMFKAKDGKFQFGGYVNNRPWVVWEFRASSYITSW